VTSQKFLVNLLPVSDFEKSAFGKIVYWFLSVGRFIIIAIELLVILAFLGRFSLDRNLTDINDRINEKQAIIKSMDKMQAEFLSLQKRLESVNTLNSQQLPSDKILTVLSSVTPADIYFDVLSLDAQSVSIDAAALSEASLFTFLSGMQKSSLFTEINLTNLTTEGSGNPEIKFSLTASLK